MVKTGPEKLELLGHAGYAENGKDIVCAGTTALTQTLIESIEALTDDKPEYTVSTGVFCLEIKNLSEKAKILVDSFFIGICMIAEEFPDYVRIV